MITSRPFSHHVIKSMHSTLMHGVRGRNQSPGQYRDGQVQIGSNARYVPPPPAEVEPLMNNLIEFMNQADDGIDPLVKAFIAHYQFEAIHPFFDGNGRLGRALLSMMVFKWQGHVHPWLYLSAYFEKYRDEYIQNMFRVSTSADWDTWIEFCLRGTIAQSKDASERCNHFRRLRDDFHDRVQSPSPRSHALIESLFRAPILSVTATARKLDVTYPTAKLDIDKLIDCGILQELEGVRPKAFFSDEIMQIAYRDVLPSQS